VKRNDVRVCPDLVQGHVLDAVAQCLWVLRDIVAEHGAAGALGDTHEQRADLAGADDADGLAVNVEAEETGETEVLLARAVERAVDLAVERHHERGGVLDDGVKASWRARA
jgi:hypothetical protein